MTGLHLSALAPLLILLILSMIFYGRGLLHIMLLAYTLALTYMAIVGSWEILFWAILPITGIIAIILFTIAMTKGDWL